MAIPLSLLENAFLKMITNFEQTLVVTENVGAVLVL